MSAIKVIVFLFCFTRHDNVRTSNSQPREAAIKREVRPDTPLVKLRHLHVHVQCTHACAMCVFLRIFMYMYHDMYYEKSL